MNECQYAGNIWNHITTEGKTHRLTRRHCRAMAQYDVFSTHVRILLPIPAAINPLTRPLTHPTLTYTASHLVDWHGRSTFIVHGLGESYMYPFDMGQAFRAKHVDKQVTTAVGRVELEHDS